MDHIGKGVPTIEPSPEIISPTCASSPNVNHPIFLCAHPFSQHARVNPQSSLLIMRALNIAEDGGEPGFIGGCDPATEVHSLDLDGSTPWGLSVGPGWIMGNSREGRSSQIPTRQPNSDLRMSNSKGPSSAEGALRCLNEDRSTL